MNKPHKLYIPRDSSSLSMGAEKVALAFKLALQSSNANNTTIVRNGSRGVCCLAPLIQVDTPDRRVAYVPGQAGDVDSLVAPCAPEVRQYQPL